MTYEQLLQILIELKDSGRCLDKEPVVFIDSAGGEHEINSVKHYQDVRGQIELSE